VQLVVAVDQLQHLAGRNLTEPWMAAALDQVLGSKPPRQLDRAGAGIGECLQQHLCGLAVQGADLRLVEMIDVESERRPSATGQHVFQQGLEGASAEVKWARMSRMRQLDPVE